LKKSVNKLNEKKINKNFFTRFLQQGCTGADDYTPDPNDCQKFYRCANGYQFAFRCGPGTAFDPAFNGCNYRESVPSCNNNNINIHVPPQSPGIVMQKLFLGFIICIC
jgi:hypothetical protein